MISFAGVGVSDPSPDDLADLSAWWEIARVWEADGAGFEAPGVDHLPKPPLFRREPPRLQVLHWPTGASRWSHFHALVSGVQLKNVRAALGSSSSGVLKLEDGAGGSVETTLHFLQPLPVLRRALGAPVSYTQTTVEDDSLYLVTLVDERYYWWMAGDKSFSASESWPLLFAQYMAAVGVSDYELDTVPAAYLTPSCRWSVGYRPQPILLDAACRQVGLRAVRTPEGRVKLVRWSAAYADARAQYEDFRRHAVAGGPVEPRDVGRQVAAACAVIFFADRADNEPEALTRTLTGVAVPDYGTATGVAGRTGQVWADLGASAGGSDRANYATEAAKDFWRWQLHAVDVAYRGFPGVTPTGLELAVEYDHSPGSGRLLTRVLRPALHDPNVYGDSRVCAAPVYSSSGSGSGGSGSGDGSGGSGGRSGSGSGGYGYYSGVPESGSGGRSGSGSGSGGSGAARCETQVLDWCPLYATGSGSGALSGAAGTMIGGTVTIRETCYDAAGDVVAVREYCEDRVTGCACGAAGSGGGAQPVSVPCLTASAPARLRVTVTGATGTCGGATGSTAVFTWDAGTTQWNGLINVDGTNDTWAIRCVDDLVEDDRLTINGTIYFFNQVATVSSFSPFSVTWTASVVSPCSGTITITATEEP